MADSQERIDALESRARTLRKLSRTLFLLGVGLCYLGFLVIWPDKGADGVLDSSRLLVPHELAQKLSEANFPTGQIPSLEIWPSSQGLRLQVGLLPIFLVLSWRLLGFFVKSWVTRSLVILIGGPIAFVPVLYLLYMGKPVSAVLVGQVSAQPVRPTPDLPTLDFPKRQIAPGVYLALRAHHLVPSSMVPALGDQAYFVLAQQAYHDKKPPEIGGHLRGMTGQWRPDDELSKTILGVLSGYAEAHGVNAGAVATDIAGGRPYQELRFHFTRWSMRLGTLLVLLGFVADVIGIRRQRSAKKLRSLLPESPEAPAQPPASALFGRRNAAKTS